MSIDDAREFVGMQDFGHDLNFVELLQEQEERAETNEIAMEIAAHNSAHQMENHFDPVASMALIGALAIDYMNHRDTDPTESPQSDTPEPMGQEMESQEQSSWQDDLADRMEAFSYFQASETQEVPEPFANEESSQEADEWLSSEVENVEAPSDFWSVDTEATETPTLDTVNESSSEVEAEDVGGDLVAEMDTSQETTATTDDVLDSSAVDTSSMDYDSGSTDTDTDSSGVDSSSDGPGSDGDGSGGGDGGGGGGE